MLFFIPFQREKESRVVEKRLCTSRSARAYVRMSTVSFVVNACGLWKKRVGEGYVSSVANSFHLLEGGLDGIESLGDESSLGEEAAFLFLGLAVDGDLDGHLGCVLGNDISEM